MDFESVFNILLKNFKQHNIEFALIGGFAMHAAGFSRSTKDIDILVLKNDLSKIKEIMSSVGYDILHESEDVCNFAGKLKELGKVDFLLGYRRYTKNMLKRAQEYGILDNTFSVKVIGPEDVIGLKVQSSSNEPSRYHHDMSDIEFLIRTRRDTLDWELIREYFKLFDRERELDQLIEKINNA